MLAQIFRGVSLFGLRLRALVAVLTGPLLYYQTVGVLAQYPAMLPEVFARITVAQPPQRAIT